ncbi:hypothetical protein EST38_g3763 [Candolleomyces aberdarensis]|uniref:Nephrocystin 3-like N-terminal domain-containing protein n=1 Tax=Candolleomyces aberdarensis TaxID=2316362 RepID=A0A4Q2DRI2_9AGAR|nr:hypothetical protein EST38_g3763 [Candolleomyces aberdarensis]
MLAHEMGSIHPQTIPKIEEAIEQCHGTSLETYLEKYILEPLRSLKRPHPLVIIIDAIDEWRDHLAFMPALSYLNSESSVVKFFITTCLDPCASRLPGSDNILLQTYALLPKSDEVIKIYFDEHFRAVPWANGRDASIADVNRLVELSGGLPLWTSTVISLLSHRFSDSLPHEILSEIISSRRQSVSGDGLRELYRIALAHLFPSSDVQRLFQLYFGATIVLQEPLSLSDFSILIGLPSHVTRDIQFALSVLQIWILPSDSEKRVYPAIMLFHLSFLEYVQAATTERAFATSAFDSHSTLGLACLNQLTSLPPPSLPQTSPLCDLHHYAVKYWPVHVSNGTPRWNDQWLGTEHCSMLQRITVDSQRRWATSFLQSLIPGRWELVIEYVTAEDGMISFLRRLAHCLGKCDGERWGFGMACLEVALRIDGGNARIWLDLGRCHNARGDSIGSLKMHEAAVEAFRHALRLRPDVHPSHAKSHNIVASGLCSCYQQLIGNTSASNAAMCCHKALSILPDPCPNRFLLLNHLAVALQAVYEHTGDIATLNEVISLHHEVLELLPATHQMRAALLNNKAIALHALYDRSSDVKTLNEVISLRREVLELRPASHPARSMSLSNLAVALCALHRHNQQIGTLIEAISLDREALALRPALHPYRPLSLINLASSLYALYQRTDDLDTQNKVISLNREAVALLSTPHPLRPCSLHNLARSLLSLYERTGALEVLDEVASLCRELLILRPPGHRYRRIHVKFLVKLLEKRFKVTKDGRDLGEIENFKAEYVALKAKDISQ